MCPHELPGRSLEGDGDIISREMIVLDKIRLIDLFSFFIYDSFIGFIFIFKILFLGINLIFKLF